MTHVTAKLLNEITILLDFAFDTNVNAKIKEIEGWIFDGKAKRWTVPVRQLTALIDRLGDALSLSYDVLQAHDNTSESNRKVRTFVANVLAAGISLDVVDGRVIGSGGCGACLARR